MTRPKLSIATWSFAEAGLTTEALIPVAVELGYDGIEFPEPEHWSRIVDAGLTIAAIRGHDALTDGLNRRENHDRIARELEANLELARQWKIPSLICFSGNRNGLADEAGAEQTADGLRRVAAAAEEAGVTLVLELLNSKVDHPDYQCDRTDWGVRVVEWVNSPRVKLLYDVYHMQIMEGDIIRTIGAHHRLFGHYHVAGNPGRHEIDDRQEINHPAVFRAIAATGFAGFIGMEFVPKGDPVAALKDAAALVEDG